MPTQHLSAFILFISSVALALSASIANAAQPSPQVQPAATILSPAQLQADLQSLQDFIAATHPDIAHSADPASLTQAFTTMAASLTQPMSVNQFWQLTATLNPLFNDAHWSVNLPAADSDLKQLLTTTGGLFPLEVHVRPDGELVVLALAGGADTPWRGAIIERINGVSASELSRQLLALRHGDNPLNRANLLGPAFQLYYATVFGTPAEFSLQLRQHGQLTSLKLAAATKAAVLGKTSEKFAENFSFRLLDANTGYLQLGTFNWPDEQQIGTFTQQAFAKMKQTGASKLIIDVRENRGGNDTAWLDHVMPYLADQPYRLGSSNKKKVIANRASATEPAGLVLDNEFTTWYQPALSNPLRFRGKVVVLTGRRTYSSAVLFCNVLQDFAFATLAGEGSYARARTTGGIQFYTLPHSKLNIIVPRFWAARPAGGVSTELLTPDWLMPDPVTAPARLVQAVQARFADQTN